MFGLLRRWSASVWYHRQSVPPRDWIGLIAVVLLTALILVRSPYLTSTPRVWAEEGTVYLSAAWSTGLRSLLIPQLGYYSLLPNLAASAASMLPLAWVPLPLMSAGLLAMLACGVAILTSRSGLFEQLGVRLVSTLGVVCVPAAIGELWFNSINAQAFLTVAAFVIILEPAPRPPQLAVFAVAALTAPPVTFLLPLVILRLLIGDPRRSRSLPLLAVAGLSALIQIAAVTLSHNDRRVRGTDEGGALTWLSFLGKTFQGPGSWAPDITVGALVLLALAIICAFYRTYGLVIIGVATALWLFVLNTAFSLGQNGGYRYWYAPSVILLMTLSYAACLVPASGAARIVSGLLCVVLLAGGVRTYITGVGRVADVSWSTWAEQATAACDGNRSTIRVWPQGRAEWVLQVPPTACAPR